MVSFPRLVCTLQTMTTVPSIQHFREFDQFYQALGFARRAVLPTFDLIPFETSMNVGVTFMPPFRKEGTSGLTSGDSEIAINLESVVHLTALFIPHLMRRTEAAVFQVSSGLAFVLMAVVPVYCATKAALHSFSLTLRHQMKDTSVKVFEIIPPIVETELDQGARERRGQTQPGIPPETVAAATLRGMEADQFEIVVGRARFLRLGSRLAPKRFFGLVNRMTNGL